MLRILYIYICLKRQKGGEERRAMVWGVSKGPAFAAEEFLNVQNAVPCRHRGVAEFVLA